MIHKNTLEMFAEQLHVYDVDQGAWEQEPNGFEANVGHVLTHLAKDLTGKNFNDRVLVRSAIAPDSIQYGLRLARWSRINIADLVDMDEAEEDIRAEVENGFDSNELPFGFASFAGAMRTLAVHLHDINHESTREGALSNRPASMLSAARLLIDSASIQSFQFDFSLEEAFDARLSFLRDRFGIPHP